MPIKIGRFLRLEKPKGTLKVTFPDGEWTTYNYWNNPTKGVQNWDNSLRVPAPDEGHYLIYDPRIGQLFNQFILGTYQEIKEFLSKDRY